MIYTFGNSHAHVFTDTHPATFGEGNPHNDFKSFSLGATIAYNFYEHHLTKIYDILSNTHFDKEKDYVMLIVGEVDCRWHLPYQANLQNRPINEIVYECVDRFYRCYTDLQKNGYKVIGWGGHPSTTAGHSDNPSEPIYGDCIIRNEISRLWDWKLGEKCKADNLPYISIIESLIDDSGLTKMEYFDDYCHLNHTKTKSLINEKFSHTNLI